jgi:hypothetical protein
MRATIGGTPTPDAAVADARAAEDHLAEIFTRLDAVEVVSDGGVVVSGSTFDAVAFPVLRRELAGAAASLEDFRAAGGAAAQTVHRLEYGLQLARARIGLYETLDAIITRDRRVRTAIEEGNFGGAAVAASAAVDSVQELASTAGSLDQHVEVGPAGEGVSVPDAYRDAVARREASVVGAAVPQVRPAVAAVAAWTTAFSEAVAAQTLLDNRDWRGAEAGFAAALDALATTQTQASRVSGPPALFTEPYTTATCGVGLLQEAFAAARQAATAARNGDQATAAEQLQVYESTYADYETECR